MTEFKKKISSLLAITLAVSAISVSSGSLVVNASDVSALNMGEAIINNASSYDDGIINPGTNNWWKSSIRWQQYMPDEGPFFARCSFRIDSVDVRCNGDIYTAPTGYFEYDVISANFDYEKSTDYEICVKVDYNTNTAEYYLDNGERQAEVGNNNDIAYFSDYALIPVTKVYSNKNGQLISYKANEDGIIGYIPEQDEWWTSSISWQQKWPGEGSFFPRCSFRVDTVGVRCKGKTYTVPTKFFSYDVISANFDYEKSTDYEICVKVDYNTNTAEYYLDDGERQEGFGGFDIAYFPDYVLIPVTKVYSDKNGQLISYNSDDDGIIGYNEDSEDWWTTSIRREQYEPGIGAFFARCSFRIDTVGVRCNGYTYTAPTKFFSYDVISANFDYEKSTNYELCIKVDYNTEKAEYYLDSGEREAEVGIGNNDIAYFPEYVLIPVTKVYSDINGQLFSYKGGKEGLIDPGTHQWWTSTIRWEQYEPGIGTFLPRCSFKIESVDVKCNSEIYTVPTQYFMYDDISGWYDYEKSSKYKLCVKVDYNTNTAEYYLDSGQHEFALGANSTCVAYFSDYALIPITDVYSDENGQLFDE